MQNVLDKVTIDAMLDKYNDFISLYHTVGEESYRQKADSVMTLMKNMFGTKERVLLSKVANT